MWINYALFIIEESSSARDALRKLNKIGLSNSVLFVRNKKKQIVGSLTDGDIRRGLLQNLQIDESCSVFMNKKLHFFIEELNSKQFKEYKKLLIRFIPILNKKNQLKKIVDLFSITNILPLDAVIMAGGKGERLRPLTENFPKPLLKVGDKPILEHTIDRLIRYGISNFSISVNYMASLLKDYFGNGEKKEISIKYIEEKEPLGTIGSLRLISNFKHEAVILTNSDLLTNIDYAEFYEKFIESKADMAVATISYDVKVPYAVMEIDKTACINGFNEKPTYTYYSNAGIYIIKTKLLKYIPKNKKFDATEFINVLIGKKKRIISYPIIGYWLDIGKIEDYLKAQQDIKLLKL
jgi:dTDP-glucose pyrophosphorylase